MLKPNATSVGALPLWSIGCRCDHDKIRCASPFPPTVGSSKFQLDSPASSLIETPPAELGGRCLDIPTLLAQAAPGTESGGLEGRLHRADLWCTNWSCSAQEI